MYKKPKYIFSDKLTPFENWWQVVGYFMVYKFSKKYQKDNPQFDHNMVLKNNNDFVHRIYHDYSCFDLSYNQSYIAFLYGINNVSWTINNSNSLFCDLDNIGILAYDAGKRYGADHKV